MRKLFLCLLSLLILATGFGQFKKSENIVVVTLDGFRWQEVFGGADSVLTFDTAARYSAGYVKDHFWAATPQERRKKLLPFFWSEIAAKGVLLGNRNYENYFNNANPYWFSYPGYNEIFTGFPDTTVNSNDKIPNKNENVFEWLNKLPEYKGKAVVFGSWGVYSSIFNEKRSGLLVNDGYRDLQGNLNPTQQLYNKLQYEMPAIFHDGERVDVATFHIGFEYMKVHKPKLIYFGLGDTDEFAHGGMYDFYLDAAQNTDDWIRQLWEYIQSTPEYKDKTTLIITTDHGRGLAAGGNWQHHGQRIAEASEMWMAAIGPSVKPAGESKEKMQAYQGQVAATISAMLGKEFKPSHKTLPVLTFPAK
jgi:hypothetical protein